LLLPLSNNLARCEGRFVAAAVAAAVAQGFVAMGVAVVVAQAFVVVAVAVALRFVAVAYAVVKLHEKLSDRV
jgi:hypothetical protein